MKTDPVDLSKMRILIVDDVAANRKLLRQTLERGGYQVSLVPSGEIALQVAHDDKPNLILLDIIMPGIDGYEVCRRLKQSEATAHIPVIFITAKQEPEAVIQGFRAGGVDYITKPFNEDEVLIRIQTHLKITQLTKALIDKNDELTQVNKELQQALKKYRCAEEARQTSDERFNMLSQQEQNRWGIEGFVGKSETIRTILKNVRQLQSAGATSVLITGESGTGKELIARAIHSGGSRSKGPFVPVNCSAIPAELVESLFFGHVRGAFTGADTSRKGYFELAHGGTLFLDEIGDMPLELQAKLLRVLEDGCVTPVGDTHERKVEVRVLAATNHDLQASIAAGRFRSDLYFRLARFTVEVPPLRERRADIPLLANHFLRMLVAEMKKEDAELTPEALSSLESYHFPGNVRELKNLIEHALILSESGKIQPAHLYFIDVPTSDLGIRNTESEMKEQSEIRIPPRPRTEEDLVLAYIKQNGSINNAECRDFLKVDFHHASYLLRKMHKAGAVVRTGGRRWARYALPS